MNIRNIALFILAIFCLFYLTYFNNHKEHPFVYAFVLIIAVLCAIPLHGCIVTEHFVTTEEAVKNIASIYNSENMVVKNLHITGGLTVDGYTKGNGIESTGGLAAAGNISGETIYAKDISATGNIACGALTTVGAVNVGSLTSTGAVNAGTTIDAGGQITASGLKATGKPFANYYSIHAAGGIQAGGSVDIPKGTSFNNKL